MVNLLLVHSLTLSSKAPSDEQMLHFFLSFSFFIYLASKSWVDVFLFLILFLCRFLNTEKKYKAESSGSPMYKVNILLITHYTNIWHHALVEIKLIYLSTVIVVNNDIWYSLNVLECWSLKKECSYCFICGYS